MTDTDPHRVDDLLAQFPGPVRLTPSPTKWGLLVIGGAAFSALIWFSSLREDGMLLFIIAGWIAILVSAFVVVLGICNLAPGGAYLELTASGFEYKSLFSCLVTPWTAASHFRVAGPDFSRHVIYDRLQSTALIPRANSPLVQGTVPLADNYGLPHDDLARLMNAWQAKTMAAQTPEDLTQQA